MSEELKIFLEEEHVEGIRYPLYADTYRQALRIILKNALKNQEVQEEEYLQQRYRNIDNIIGFSGDRGSGKTTAMDDFCSLLGNLKERKIKETWLERMTWPMEERIQLDKRRLNFSILESIDASLLEEKEDLIELILAQMYENCDFDNMEQGYFYDSGKNRIKDTKMLFSEAYRNYGNVKHVKRKEDWGESVISRLRSVPSSRKTQMSFDKLIKEYFRVKGFDEQDFNFLVIAIDDLDMNLRYGFEMLEQLHKYLAHPRVIILTTFDYEQLSWLSQKHFAEAAVEDISYSAGRGDGFPVSGKQCRRLSEDYLAKVLPLDNRIYMPTMKKLTNELHIDENQKKLNQKKFILYKIARYMHIYYDGTGVKKHFAETKTVRNLVNYNRFLNSMNLPDFSQCQIMRGAEENKTTELHSAEDRQKQLMQEYDENHERFNRDIQERMTYEILTPGQIELFKKIRDRDLERRAKYVIAFHKSDLSGDPLSADIDESAYCYGDFLECIYRWGRVKFEMKPLICCILASFTSEMVREYLCCLYHPDKQSRLKAEKRMQGFLGESFGNDWTGAMLPKVVLDNKITGSNKENWDIAPKGGFIRKLNTMPMTLRFSVELEPVADAAAAGNLEKAAEEFACILQEDMLIQKLECLEQLLVKDHEESRTGFSIDCQFMLNDTSDNINRGELKVQFSNRSVNLDILGFVAKSLRTAEEQKQFARGCIDGLTESLARVLKIQNAGEKEIIRRTLDEKLDKLSLFGGKDSENIHAAFPFYDLDLSYNIIKRVRKKCKAEFPMTITTNELAGYIGKVYEYINKELEEQAAFYKEADMAESCFQYQRIFENHPYVRYMRSIKNEEKGFANVLDSLLRVGASGNASESDVDG